MLGTYRKRQDSIIVILIKRATLQIHRPTAMWCIQWVSTSNTSSFHVSCGYILQACIQEVSGLELACKRISLLASQTVHFAATSRKQYVETSKKVFFP